MPKVILRQNWGSYRIVRRVFAYDPVEGLACVLLVSSDKTPQLDMVTRNELEAVDESNNFADVGEELLKRARFTLDRTNVPA